GAFFSGTRPTTHQIGSVAPPRFYNKKQFSLALLSARPSHAKARRFRLPHGGLSPSRIRSVSRGRPGNRPARRGARQAADASRLAVRRLGFRQGGRPTAGRLRLAQAALPTVRPPVL